MGLQGLAHDMHATRHQQAWSTLDNTNSHANTVATQLPWQLAAACVWQWAGLARKTWALLARLRIRLAAGGINA